MSNRREIALSPDINVAATIAKANKVAARAANKGLSGGFAVTIETKMVPGKNLMGFEDASLPPRQVKYLIIEGAPAAYEGWAFVAKAEWVNGLPVITGSPWYEGEPVDRASLVEGGCDHCGVSRQRKSVIIVEKDGARKQVGKQCLKDYLGHEAPVSWFSDRDPFAEFGGYEGGGVEFFSLISDLTWAAAIVRVKGFVPASHYDRRTTKALVSIATGKRPTDWAAAAEWDEVQALIDWEADGATAEAILAFARTLEGDTDYIQNVKAVVGTDSVYYDPKYRGLVVSLAGVYARDVEKKAREAADPVVEAEFGKVGEKVTVTLTAVSSRAFDSGFGTTYANTFTGEGHRFKWVTGTRSFETGEKVTMKGTIKGYDEWDGRKFTVLTRCKEVAC